MALLYELELSLLDYKKVTYLKSSIIKQNYNSLD